MRFLKGMKAAVLFSVCLGWLDSEGQAQDIISNSGASISVSDGAVLTVRGGFVSSVSGAAAPSVENNGTIQVSENWQLGSPALHTGTGTLELNGTRAQQISGTMVHNLTVNNPAGVTQLDNLTVTGNLTITDGNLTAAAGKTLNLEGAISETPDHMYEGALAKTVQVTAVTASSSFGNIGISFDNTDGGNWGNVTVIRHTGPGSYISNPNSPSIQGINRNWSIAPELRPDRKTISLTLSWFTEEDNGLTFPGNQAQVWRSEDDGSTWIRVEGLKPITTNGNVRSVTVQTNSAFLWTVADEITPLPVTWLHFSGKATDKGTELSWATASERDTESFFVERAVNGRDFHSVAELAAAGNSTIKLQYRYTDSALPVQGHTLYYRLRQVDLDGKFEYSKVIAVSRKGEIDGLKIAVFPNPFSRELTVSVNKPMGKAQFRLYDIQGKNLYHRQLEMRDVCVVLDGLSDLAVGLYLLEITAEGTTKVFKVLKE
ncbi:T9SS type A sorting domain-containing protein [uncultured Pontibacter sp.]|uniref:T9SS type A sorting domain-containing protein n=1 Tax=uncultured Pontibacter sp. TaxID=453356 RepID=UPI0026297357|nr:T9SS type A sorting domain-containing protein [uncultured Pontibacter sp.]